MYLVALSSIIFRRYMRNQCFAASFQRIRSASGGDKVTVALAERIRFRSAGDSSFTVHNKYTVERAFVRAAAVCVIRIP